MANYTATTNMTLEQAIINGSMVTPDELTINSGAIVTVDQTPSMLMDRVIINQGELHVDGTTISAGNIINFIGRGGKVDGTNDETIVVNGQGTLRVTGAWINIGTTDGTDSQVFDLSVATGTGYWDKGGVDFCPHSIPMIQVETGRRINYIGDVGLAPEVGDFVTLVSDRTVMGKIHSVGAGYMVVWLLSGTFVGGEAIQIRKVIDNNGSDLQITWTANVSGADVKEAGVYEEFGNSHSGGSTYISGYGSGLGGMVFDQSFKGLTITMGGSTSGGFVPPSGCDVRVPNVNFGTADTVSYDINEVYSTINTDENEWYALELSAGGTIDFDTCNFGYMTTIDIGAFAYSANYVGAVVNLGSPSAGTPTSYNHCVVVQDCLGSAEAGYRALGCLQDLVNGATVSFCKVFNSRPQNMAIGAYTSLDISITDCISSNAGQGVAMDASSVHGYNLLTVSNVTVDNCMYFGNTHIEQENALNVSACKGVDVTNFYASMTQDYTPQSEEFDTVYMLNTSDSKIIGLEIIGNGVPANNLIRTIDCNDLKFRCAGMIDDKIDMGSDGEFLVTIEGLASNIDIARMWKDNGAIEEAVSVAITAKNVTVQNCSGKYLSELQPSGGNNIRFKGVHGGAGTFGGTEGWEDVYLSSYGNSFHDGFQSDTNGSIACLMITPSTTTNETTVVAGNPLFFKDGDLDVAIGDIIIFEQGYFARGHTGFTGLFTTAITLAGYHADEFGSTIILDFQWQLDGGSWNGIWLDLRTPENLTSISGNIEAGIKFKIRLTANAVKTSMSGILIDSTTTLQAQSDNLHPIDQVETNITVTNLAVGSMVKATKASNNESLYVGLESSNQVVFTTAYVGAINVEVRKASAFPYYKPYTTQITSSGRDIIITALQELD